MNDHSASDPDSESDRTDDEAPGSICELVSEFAVQDWLIVIEALVACAGPPPSDGSSPPPNGILTRARTRRAWELVDALIVAIDLPPDEVADRIDDDWRGHEHDLGHDVSTLRGE